VTFKTIIITIRNMIVLQTKTAKLMDLLSNVKQ